MNKLEGRIISSKEVASFKVDDSYTSKMLLDDYVAGEPSVHINEGTLKGGCKTEGDTHEQSEVYYIVKGEAILHLGDKVYDISCGCLVYIPTDTFHSLDNKSQTEDLVILTIWKNTKGNGVYTQRLKEWGTSYKTIYDD